jgi:hypothetical protein
MKTYILTFPADDALYDLDIRMSEYKLIWEGFGDKFKTCMYSVRCTEEDLMMLKLTLSFDHEEEI